MYEQSDTAGIRRESELTEDWKDDLGEYSRRIWEWWLMRWLKVEKFDYFGQAIRKVVLWKMFSAIVERYVSVTNACGSNLKKPMLQDRMYARCNNKLYENAHLLGQVEDNDKYTLVWRDYLLWFVSSLELKAAP